MFGYVRVFAPQMRVSDHEAYKSAYCGFCKKLGRDYGHLWRMTLSYDFAFVKVLSEAMRQDKLTACRERCIAHPLKKRYCMKAREEDKMLSAAAVLLTAAKVRDNVADSKGYFRPFWKLANLVIAGSVKKASRDYPLIAAKTTELSLMQQQAESHAQCSKDRAADPTGAVMASFFEMLSDDEKQKRVLHVLGYQIGRYVYFMDALDDLEKDQKEKNFNPFLPAEGTLTKQDAAAIRKEGMQTVNRCIGGAIEAYELLMVYRMKPILDNVLYFGLQHAAMDLTADRNCKKHKMQKEMEIY